MERLRGETKDEMLAPKDGAWSWRVIAGDFRFNELCVLCKSEGENRSVNLIIIILWVIKTFNINVGCGLWLVVYIILGLEFGNYYY